MSDGELQGAADQRDQGNQQHQIYRHRAMDDSLDRHSYGERKRNCPDIEGKVRLRKD